MAKPKPTPKPTPALGETRGRASAPKDPHWRPPRISHSFSSAEIVAVVDIMTALMRGGDASTIARSEAARSVYAKFVRMKQKLDTTP